MKPIPEVRLTCVSNYTIATYSGMLPGVLAGHHSGERMTIDLVRLCASVRARLIVGDVSGLDLVERRLQFSDRPPLPFDVLSIGTGSVPSRNGIELDDTVVSIKPMQTFLPRLESRVQELLQRDLELFRIVVVGAGVGGVEVSLCLRPRLEELLDGTPFELTLVSATDSVAHGTLPRTQRLLRQELESCGAHLRFGVRVRRVSEGKVEFDDGETIRADMVLWATNAAPPPVLEKIELPKDPRGFLLTRPTLQTTADEPIFAVGDAGTIEGSALPKAGVYAVRQGPVLWKNIARQLVGRELLEYRPQKGFLKLAVLGDDRAVAEYQGATFKGRLAWKLKDWIDSRFMDKYQDYTAMEMTADANATTEQSPRCAGCGGKVSGSVLTHVLRRLDLPAHEQVVLGLETPDDAAVVKPVNGHPLAVTTDFFQAPLDDPFLSGRIAALNSASDVFALGARPIAALALATLPLGKPRQQEQLLYEMLAGSLAEFRRMDATLVGGHTIEGPQITIGFTMLADQGDSGPRTKAALRSDDVLILTKPLGTGVLLVAQMQADCRAAWMQQLLDSMLLSNQPAAALIDEFDISGLTDITGFGLAGHLLEMLNASDLVGELNLDKLPLLAGVSQLVKHGVESTLAPANRVAEAQIEVEESLRVTPAYQVLFDPQTSGGLLLGVREKDVDAVLDRLSVQSGVAAAAIGRVRDGRSGEPRLQVVR